MVKKKEEVDFMKRVLNYTMSRQDISSLSEDDMIQYLIYSDRDRKELTIANQIYWWCIEEINIRHPELDDV